MRVILDTSVIVSGLISPHSPPAQIVSLWQQGTIQLLYSAEIFAELQDVLHRQWLQQRLAHRPNRISGMVQNSGIAPLQLNEDFLRYRHVEMGGSI